MNRTANEVLDHEFLQVRAKILEVAAFFDRLDASPTAVDDEARLGLLQQGTAILQDELDNKAARVQLLFSREYDPAWREKYGV